MNLFTYGTLQFDEVWRRVAGPTLTTCAGWLEGYAAYRVGGQDYPGVVARGGARTPGTIHTGADQAVLDRLDAFEGDQYRRSLVEVVTEGGRPVDCQAYLIAPSAAADLTDEAWTRESFLAGGGLERFLRRLAVSTPRRPRD